MRTRNNSVFGHFSRSDRLLNPTKSEFGKISKPILQQISTNIRTGLNVNQWQNSPEVTKWFKNIKNKNLNTFNVFDIQEFYPSIGEKLWELHYGKLQRSTSVELVGLFMLNELSKKFD